MWAGCCGRRNRSLAVSARRCILAHRARLRDSRSSGESTTFVARSRALDNRNAARVILDGSAATAVKFRKYLLVRTQMSAVTGLLVGIFAWITGLQFAAEWGVIAFVAQLHSFYRSVHRNTVSDAAGDDAVRQLAGRCRHLHLPEHHPVRDRQLCRAARVRQRAGDLAFRRAVCDLLLDLSMGHCSAPSSAFRSRSPFSLSARSIPPADGWPTCSAVPCKSREK